MYSFPNSARLSRRCLRFAVPVVLVFMAACASTPPIPTSNLEAARQAIANAERVGAGTHAIGELGEARANMSAAQRAIDEEQMLAASQLADKARADAELAAARTNVAKAVAVNQEMKNSTTTLIEEMQRKTGDTE
jgi:hypothetical protein